MEPKGNTIQISSAIPLEHVQLIDPILKYVSFIWVVANLAFLIIRFIELVLFF